MAGGQVQLRSLTKRFDEHLAVNSIDALINAGEFFSLLGPSGCGKTTTLRMIAGFERPTSGEILLDGEDVAIVPPHERNVHTVFQNYALFPHLNVYDNIAFGLRRHNVAKDEIRQRVEESLRVELKALQEEVGITFVFVTHDQEEALSMSDRLAVMSNGRIEQIGTPDEVYEDPATVFVADFLGISNLMDAEPTAWGTGECTVRVGEFSLRATCGETGSRGSVKIVARPERLRLLDHGRGEGQPNCLPGIIDRTIYVGASRQVIVRLATGAVMQVSIANTGAEHRVFPRHPGDGSGPSRCAARTRPVAGRRWHHVGHGPWRRRCRGARGRRRTSLNAAPGPNHRPTYTDPP